MQRRLSSAIQELKILRARLTSLVLRQGVRAPVFLIGCGRSGKSTLGTALALHPAITFLDESRPLWIACFPQTDIWTEKAAQRRGRLYLNKNDANESSARRLSALFQNETKKRAKPQLVQALAVNSFRLDFLRTIFEDAKFIHIVRNGLNVAQEIAQRADKQGWYGRNGYKWKQLVDYAASSSTTVTLPALCETNFDRGLLEWRLCLEAIQSVTPLLPHGALLEIRYEDLIAQPRECLRRSAEFIGLSADPAWESRAIAIAYRSPIISKTTAREKDLLIGGALLQRWLG